MNFEQRTHPTRHLIGATIRTSHANAPEEIPAFWGQILQTRALDTIDTNAPGVLYAVYTDMEDEWRGAYTMWLAVEVSPDAPTPEGFARLVVDGRERTCTHIDGSAPEHITGAWRHIWHDWSRRAERAYGVDLEIHRFDETGMHDVEIALSMAQAR